MKTCDIIKFNLPVLKVNNFNKIEVRPILLMCLFIGLILTTSSCKYTGSQEKTESITIDTQLNSKDNDKIGELTVIDSNQGFKMPSGEWIDTMPDDINNISAYEGKTYYPNFTVHLPQDLDSLSDPYQEIKIYVKSEGQKPVRWIYPLTESELFGDKKIKISKVRRISNNGFYANIMMEKSNGDMKYKFEGADQIDMAVYSRKMNDILFCELMYLNIIGSKVREVKTELLIFNDQGERVAHIMRDGTINVSITPNKKYLCMNSGGYLTEDTKLPYRGAIYDIEKKKYVWQKEFECKRVVPSSYNALSNTIWIFYYPKNCADKNETESLFLWNTETDKIYRFTSIDKASAGQVSMDDNKRMCYNVRKGDTLIKKYLTLEEDFRRIQKLP